MRAWVEDLACMCVAFGIHMFARARGCLFFPLSLSLSPCVYNVMGVWSVSPESRWFTVFTIHTPWLPASWGSRLSSCISYSGLRSRRHKNRPSPQKDDCFLSLSLFHYVPPSLIFSLLLCLTLTVSLSNKAEASSQEMHISHNTFLKWKQIPLQSRAWKHSSVSPLSSSTLFFSSPTYKGLVCFLSQMDNHQRHKTVVLWVVWWQVCDTGPSQSAWR